MLGLVDQVTSRHLAGAVLIGQRGSMIAGQQMHQWWLAQCYHKLGLTEQQQQVVSAAMSRFQSQIRGLQHDILSLLAELEPWLFAD